MNVEVRATKTSAEQALATAFAAARGTLPGEGAIAALRDDAFKRFDAKGLPHRRVEEWKYTDLRALMREAKPLAGPAGAKPKGDIAPILTGVEADRIRAFKVLAVKAAAKVAGGRRGYGMLIDEKYGREAFFEAARHDFDWIGRPVELPGSRPLRFEFGQDIGSQLVDWPVTHTIKCLCHYHPDDPAALKEEQQQKLLALFQASRKIGRELLEDCTAILGPGHDVDDILPNLLRPRRQLGDRFFGQMKLIAAALAVGAHIEAHVQRLIELRIGKVREHVRIEVIWEPTYAIIMAIWVRLERDAVELLHHMIEDPLGVCIYRGAFPNCICRHCHDIGLPRRSQDRARGGTIRNLQASM